MTVKKTTMMLCMLATAVMAIPATASAGKEPLIGVLPGAIDPGADGSCHANCVIPLGQSAGNYAIFSPAGASIIVGGVPFSTSDYNASCMMAISNKCPEDCDTITYDVFRVSGIKPPTAVTVVAGGRGVFPWANGTVQCAH